MHERFSCPALPSFLEGSRMAQSDLVLHCGAVPVTADELGRFRTPPPEGKWFPVSHASVLGTVKSTLHDAGYEIRNERLGVMRDGSRFFGTLDLATPLATGVSLAVGVRNSVDKSFPLGFVAGSRVFCCDNLAFRSELMVKRKHTLRGEARFAEGIAQAVMSLTQFKEMEQARIRAMVNTDLKSDLADALILRAYEKGIISILDLAHVLKEWRQPSFDEFSDRTVWSLFNAFTTALGQRALKQPQAFAVQTMRLNSLLEVKDAASPHYALAT